jgi:lysine 2,3-aminomutase
MSSDKTLGKILDEILAMAQRKAEKNRSLPDGEKLAEIVRVRIGTRLPVYLPQRITLSLVDILKSFREKASEVGIRQFLIQTHFVSPMEVTPESSQAIQRLSHSRLDRHQPAGLHGCLLPEGTLGQASQSVERYRGPALLYLYGQRLHGKQFRLCPNARVVQEQLEEKAAGRIDEQYYDTIRGSRTNPN